MAWVTGLPMLAPSLPVCPPTQPPGSLTEARMGARHSPSLQTHEPLSAALQVSIASSVWLPWSLVAVGRSPVQPLPQAPASATSWQLHQHERSPTPPHLGTCFSVCLEIQPPPHLSGFLLLSLPDCSDVPPLRRGRRNYHVPRTCSRPSPVLMLCYI